MVQPRFPRVLPGHIGSKEIRYLAYRHVVRPPLHLECYSRQGWGFLIRPPLAYQKNPAVDDPCDALLNSREQNDCQYPRLLRSLQRVDQFVADLTDYLASRGELSNTYNVYYTDNANHWGEHRLDYGKLTPYETDTGFPLLIRGPGVPQGTQGTSSRLLVGNHDIAPTFARIAGASVPSFVDGRSFLRIANDDPTNDNPWRTALYQERRWDASWALPPKSSPQYVPPYEGVKEETRIYLRYRDDPWTTKPDPGFEEFYDVGADPYQACNLAYYGEGFPGDAGSRARQAAQAAWLQGLQLPGGRERG